MVLPKCAGRSIALNTSANELRIRIERFSDQANGHRLVGGQLRSISWYKYKESNLSHRGFNAVETPLGKLGWCTLHCVVGRNTSLLVIRLVLSGSHFEQLSRQKHAYNLIKRYPLDIPVASRLVQGYTASNQLRNKYPIEYKSILSQLDPSISGVYDVIHHFDSSYIPSKSRCIVCCFQVRRESIIHQ